MLTAWPPKYLVTSLDHACPVAPPLVYPVPEPKHQSTAKALVLSSGMAVVVSPIKVIVFFSQVFAELIE